MPCRVTSRSVSNRIVIELSGKLHVPEETALRDEITRLLAQGHRNFVIDLTDLSYIDSSGVGQLICVWISIQKAGGKLVLFRPNPHLIGILKAVKLSSVFSISYDEPGFDTRGEHNIANSA